MLAPSPSSLVSNIFLKPIEDRAMVAIGSLVMTAVFYGLIVLIDCVKDVPLTKTNITSKKRPSIRPDCFLYFLR